MITLKEELDYLNYISNNINFDNVTSGKLKEYVHKVINCNTTEEIYKIYLIFTKFTRIKFPKIENNIKYKIEEDVEAVKIKFTVSSIDKILSTRFL